jgi:hypothetical protein
MLWRYNKEAVALRIAFFTSARPGGEAHTVLVRDIPGLPYGTIAARIEDTVLRFLPKFIKRRIVVRPACMHPNLALQSGGHSCSGVHGYLLSGFKLPDMHD